MRAEVLVIGGGPAGLAAAIAAAQAGFSVEVAEPCIAPVVAPLTVPPAPDRTPADTFPSLPPGFSPGFSPIDKCCGEGLLPPAVQALAALGISPFELARFGAPIHGIQFRHGSRQVRASFSKHLPGAGLRRLQLHTLLALRAHALGITITPASARLRLNEPDGSLLAEVGGHRRTPLWILGADGTQSATRAAAGLERGHLHSRRFGLRQHYILHEPQTLRHVEVHWARGAQACLTPIGHGAAGLAISSHHRIFHTMQHALAHFPALQARLGPPLPDSTPRGAVSCHRSLRRVVHRNFALIGDASGGVDSLTGEGLALAFQQALLLAEAMRNQDLSRYQAAHTSLMRRPRLMSRALLAMGAYPALTAAAMSCLHAIPGLFQGLLQTHNQPIPSGDGPTRWPHSQVPSKTPS